MEIFLHRRKIFGMSRYINEIHEPINIEEYQDLYYEGVKYSGIPNNKIDYVISLEFGCIKFLLANIK